MLTFERMADDLWTFFFFWPVCLGARPWLCIFVFVFLIIMLPYQDVVYQDE